MKILEEGININYITNNEAILIQSEPISISGSKLEMIGKRAIDIIGATIGAISLIPITLGIYTVKLIKNDKSPIFYVQKRIGKDGKIFTMYKYSSMVVDADKKLNKYLKENKEAKEEYEKYKKLKNDPRVTSIGRFLRRTSLDEFPQFINVLKGEMSLVGPRPYLRREKKEMGSSYHYIIQCKPGITGFWQVNGRSNVDFQERLKMDIEYVNNNNLKIDYQLLKDTVFKTVKREGAI